MKVDRTGWPSGPWDSEPDEFRGKAHGLDFLCLRMPWGNWCGYVGVDSSHPAYERSEWENTYTIDQVLSGEAARLAPVQKKLNDLNCHGGVTYTQACDVRGEGLWWIGFDCGHSGDFQPACPKHGVYRDLEYVKSECVKLAEQLWRMT